jgi:hypothetical protein
MRRQKPPCTCELVAYDSKGREVPMNHPSMTGVAYRQPPKHGGRCSSKWPGLRGGLGILGELEAEGRKLEGP